MLSFDPLGQPVSRHDGEPHIRHGRGWAEASAVFVEGTRLATRWRDQPCFTVLELGFGVGVNFLCTLECWLADPRRASRLVFVSLEANPLSAPGLEQAHRALGLDSTASRSLRSGWPITTPGLHRVAFKGGAVTLILGFGTAEHLLPRLEARCDAIFLDGPSPAHDPGIWSARTIRHLGRLARPGAVAAARVTASGVVAALADAGFEVETSPAHGDAPARLSARYAPRRSAAAASPPRSWAPRAARREVLVVGAGLAGCAIAGTLGERGWKVDLLEQHASPAQAGSGQPMLVDHPHLSVDDNRLARLTRAALSMSDSHDRERSREGNRIGARLDHRAVPTGHEAIGRIALGFDPATEERQREAIGRLGFPASFATYLERDQASSIAGLELASGGVWFPGCRAIDPAAQCRAWIDRAAGAIVFHPMTAVARLARHDDQWVALDAEDRVLAQAPVAILANAGDALRLGWQPSAPLRRIRGQSTLLGHAMLPGLRTVIGARVLACPLHDGRVLVGSSYDEGDSLAPDAKADRVNLLRLAPMLSRPSPGLAALLARATRVRGSTDSDGDAPGSASRPGSVGFRWIAGDRLPLIGPLADEAAARANAARHTADDRRAFAVHPGLFAAYAFGSRGLLWARLAAEVLGAMLDDEPVALETDLLASIDPARFLRKAARHAML